MINKIFRVLFIAVYLLPLMGCRGIEINDATAPLVADEFTNGKTDLNRNNPIALPKRNELRAFRELWEKRDWNGLSQNVIENGYDMDLLWFYLGEAANGKGFREAAQIYYKKALIDFHSHDRTRSCTFYTDNRRIVGCIPFVFPRDIISRIGSNHQGD